MKLKTIKKAKIQVTKTFNRYQERSKGANTITELVKGKQEFLTSLISSFPLEEKREKEKEDLITVILKYYYSGELYSGAIISEIRTELLEENKWCQNKYNNIFTYCSAKIKDSFPIDSRAFKIDLIRAIPLESNSCYFCIVDTLGSHAESCSKCSYSSYHGICNDSFSDYRKIIDSIRKLTKAIKEDHE